jgi:hypothetical protein
MEAQLWISGLSWDPWQQPSRHTGTTTAGDETRTAYLEDSRLRIAYVIWLNLQAVYVREGGTRYLGSR